MSQQTQAVVNSSRVVNDSASHGDGVRRDVDALRALYFEESPTPLLVFEEAQHTIVDCNRAAERLFNLSRARMLGLSRKTLLVEAPVQHDTPPLQPEPVGRGVLLQVANGAPLLATMTERRLKKTAPVLTLTALTPLADAEGSKETSRKALLRRSVLMDKSHDGIAIINQEHRVIEVNQRFAAMLGYTVEEALNLRTWDWEAMHSEEDIRKQFNDLSEVHFIFETRHRRKDGSFYDAEVSASGAMVEGEAMVFTVTRDITARKRMEEALRVSEERFRLILDQVESIAVQGYGPDGEVRYWNQASSKVYGYSPEEAMGKNLLDLIIPEPMRVEVRAALEQMVATGKGVPAAELMLRRKDGALTPVFSSHAVLLRTGLPPELFCIDVDISALKKIEQELRHAKDAAEIANKAKSLFLANMSHEIRTPLNGVLGMLQLLDRTKPTKDQKEYLQHALKACRRLSQLLTDLLDLSRIEAGKVSTVELPFEIRALRDSVLELFSLAAKAKSLRLEFLVDGRTPSKLLGDETRIRQILFNLVGNAIKFTQVGHVTVEVSPLAPLEDGRSLLLFTVSDSGPGIPRNQLKDILEPFVQGDASYVRTHQGAGLGLSIVRGLTELLHGALSIESEEGEGATVFVSLPFKVPSDAVSVASESAAIETQGWRILLVEDDEINARAEQGVLTRAGHTVSMARNGQEALGLLTENTYDLVLMDIHMPVMDGLEAVRRIRADRTGRFDPTIPVVAITAYAMSGDRERFLAAGMNEYISKPVSMETLATTVARTMEQARREKRSARARQ
jgi:PAS domain S-box-containing protein